MDLTSRFLCNIALYSTGPCFYHQSHPQLGIVFALTLSIILSGVISPLISSSILGMYWPGEFIFQCAIFLPFVLFMMFSRQESWSSLPFPSPVAHVLSELSTMTHPSWAALYGMADCFMSVPCDYTTPYLEHGESPHNRRSWPWAFGISSWSPLLILDVGYILSAARCSSTTQPPLTADAVWWK